MEPRISIITLGVRDLHAARAFYAEGLGWPEIDRGGPEILFLQLSASQMLACYPLDKLAEDAGMEVPRTGAFAGITFAQNVVSKEEVDATLQRAAAAGGEITVAAEEVFWGGYRGYFRDPNGYCWEIAYNPFWKELEG